MGHTPSHLSRLEAGPGSAASVTESAELLQIRLRLFAGLLAALLAVFYLGGLVVVGIYHPRLFLWIHLHPTKLVNLADAAIGGGVVLFLRRQTRSTTTLRTLDVAFTLTMTLSFVAAFTLLPLGFIAQFGSMLITSLALSLRAALVPSPPRRTLALALTTGAALIVGGYALASADPSLPRLLNPTIVAFASLIWSGAVAAVTTVTSREIYGLTRQVRSALRLGQYTLLEKLGEGGMGVVYRARHAMLRRPTAVKLLPPSRAGAASLARFEREVQLTSMLTHPNTIAIYDYGRASDGVFYYAMEYVDGISLEELVEHDGPQPQARVIHVLRQAVGALGEAHRAGLIHRDVKPANILLCDRGGLADTVKMLDFGLVKQLEGHSDPMVTQAGTITGTPAYMAPEMITTPESIDGRADLYALGCVGYFMLTGRTVFEGDSVVEVCGHHLHTEPPSPSQHRDAALDAELERLVLDCLQKSASNRPATAAELDARLSELATRHAWTSSEASSWWALWRSSHPSRFPDVATAMATTVPG